MLDSLSAGVSGLDAFQQQMDIIGNNIANINTTGFKAARSDLADSFSDTLEAATAATSNSLGNNAMQVGTGVTTTAVTNDWSPGAINPTGVSTDLAINGNGFFVVQDPNSTTQYVTQDGTFSLNSAGYLVTTTGMQVLDNTGKAIQINNNSTDTAAMQSYSINTTGVITVNLSDGTSFTRGQLGLQTFQNPQALVSAGENLYTNMANAGPLAAAGIPGSSGLGTIQSGALELSNVDLSSEMADLITAQRAFEANSKIITTSDELLQDVVNMKR
ncbi:MAG: flagellar hook-basal body complex protein [Verrucomicrobiota bacterium]|jgi:flagellar hook protein FlgE